ncbi:MAG TPA: hypothetical protein VL860_09200, partial [Planctomycetota bacterium]|nr:hypothetical protein [Planctomycetota bacterium]
GANPRRIELITSHAPFTRVILAKDRKATAFNLLKDGTEISWTGTWAFDSNKLLIKPDSGNQQVIALDATMHGPFLLLGSQADKIAFKRVKP